METVMNVGIITLNMTIELTIAKYVLARQLIVPMEQTEEQKEACCKDWNLKSCLVVDVNTEDLDGLRDINVFDHIMSADLDEMDSPHEFVYFNKKRDEAYFR